MNVYVLCVWTAVGGYSIRSVHQTKEDAMFHAQWVEQRPLDWKESNAHGPLWTSQANNLGGWAVEEHPLEGK